MLLCVCGGGGGGASTVLDTKALSQPFTLPLQVWMDQKRGFGLGRFERLLWDSIMSLADFMLSSRYIYHKLKGTDWKLTVRPPSQSRPISKIYEIQFLKEMLTPDSNLRSTKWCPEKKPLLSLWNSTSIPAKSSFCGCVFRWDVTSLAFCFSGLYPYKFKYFCTALPFLKLCVYVCACTCTCVSYKECLLFQSDNFYRQFLLRISISECKSSSTVTQPISTMAAAAQATKSSFEVCKQTCQDDGKELASLTSYTDYRCALGSTDDQIHGVIVGAREIFTSESTHIVSRENGTMVKNFGAFPSTEENGVFHEDGTFRNGSTGVNCIYLKYRSYYAVPCTLPYNHIAQLRCACQGESYVIYKHGDGASHLSLCVEHPGWA